MVSAEIERGRYETRCLLVSALATQAMVASAEELMESRTEALRRFDVDGETEVGGPDEGWRLGFGFGRRRKGSEV